MAGTDTIREAREATGGPAGSGAGLDGRLRSLVLPTRASSFPRWLQIVDRIHSTERPEAAVADLIVVAVAGFAAGLTPLTSVEVAAALVVAFVIARVYASRTPLETQGLLWYPARTVTSVAFVVLMEGAIARRAGLPHVEALTLAAWVFGSLVFMRYVAWLVLAGARRAGIGLRPTLVVGTGGTARVVADKLLNYPEAGLQPVGILGPDGRREVGEGMGTGALPEDLAAIVAGRGIRHIVLVPEGNHDVGVLDCLQRCDGLDVSFSMLPPLSDLFIHPSLVTQVGGLPLIALGKVTHSRQNLPGKRSFDLIVGGALLILSAPVLAAAALAVKLGDGGPIFYRQSRVGQGGRMFQIPKFRSMVVGAESYVSELTGLNVTDGLLFKVQDDPRITRVGRVLRRLSIDELPQLWSVVKGEMSLVGPRPLAVDPKDFGPLDGRRHSVLPGITGYWQVAGNNGLTYQEMVKLDLAYIQNWSLWLDMTILARTVSALVHRRGPC
ncbi:MAG: sugar transferase [Acidimicrobiales bacterium]